MNIRSMSILPAAKASSEAVVHVCSRVSSDRETDPCSHPLPNPPAGIATAGSPKLSSTELETSTRTASRLTPPAEGSSDSSASEADNAGSGSHGFSLSMQLSACQVSTAHLYSDGSSTSAPVGQRPILVPPKRPVR